MILHLSESKQGHYYPENVEWHGTEETQRTTIYLLGECVGCTTHGCSSATYSTVVCLHVIYGYTSSIPLLYHWRNNNKFGCVPFAVSWSLLFPWSLNIEYRRKKIKTKQQSSAKVSQWEWKPYEDERHEHVCECVVGWFLVCGEGVQGGDEQTMGSHSMQ